MILQRTVRSLLLPCTLLLFAGGCGEEKPAAGIPGGLMEQARYEMSAPSEPPAAEPEITELPLELGENPRKPEPPPNQGIFRVAFETSAGNFVVEVDRSWSPNGAQRFYELVQDRFYDDCRFFRVVPGFVVQFGINGTPDKQSKWDINIPDDPVRQSNRRGTVTFATSGPGTRTSQLFINFNDNPNLDGIGFAPIGRVVEGMVNIDSINPEYGESPLQQLIEVKGNGYLLQKVPRLDYISRARLVRDNTTAPQPEEGDATEGTESAPAENNSAANQSSSPAEPDQR